jgi:hypothetical protein
MTDTSTTAAAADSDVQQSTALVPVEERAALALNSTKTEEHLKELATKHKDIVLVKDKAGREQAHGAAMELQKARTTIQKVSKTARDDATKFAKAVIAEENRLIGIIEKEEDRLFKVRDAWDAEQERIKAEKVAAEQKRVDALRARIDAIANLPLQCATMKPAEIKSAIFGLEVTKIDESFEEYRPHAENAYTTSLAKLNELLAAAVAREEEAARLAAERAELDRIRAEQAAQAAELERQRQEQEAAVARTAAEAALKAQAAIDEANAKARREAAEREAFQKQQQDAFEAEKNAAQALLHEQAKELAEKQAAIDAQIKAQREAEEAARREQEAKAAAERAEREAAEARACEDAELAHASSVVAIVAEAFDIGPEEAEQYILRAAATLSENQKVAA